jgi:hypothetical protein
MEVADSILLEGYRLGVDRKSVWPNDPESYAGGSGSSWQSHPCQTGKTKGRSQTKCRPWSSRLVDGRGGNTPNPEESVTKPPEPMEETEAHVAL